MADPCGCTATARCPWALGACTTFARTVPGDNERYAIALSYTRHLRQAGLLEGLPPTVWAWPVWQAAPMAGGPPQETT
jgi:hypothetical protein